MPNLYPLASHVFRRLPPERARDLTLWLLEAGFGRFMVGSEARRLDPPILQNWVWNLNFANPIGLAAGFDKDARVPDAVLKNWGLGFVEVGTVTPKPQYGNRKPRIFRLRDDEAIINRMGFNSRGLSFVVNRLRERKGRPGTVGVNLGKNRNSTDTTQDYETGIRATAKYASYLVVNISSPNTPGLRDLQRRAPLEALLRRLIAVRDETNSQIPLLVKIAPDLSPSECADIAEAVLDCKVNGIVVSNTTTDRPSDLVSREARQNGGLSGKPLFVPSTNVLAQIYTNTGGKIPLIGVGGVRSAADAFEKICAGASLVQLYTALAFQGPSLVSDIKDGLAHLLAEQGFSSISEAVGSRSDIWLRATSQTQASQRNQHSMSPRVASPAFRPA